MKSVVLFFFFYLVHYGSAATYKAAVFEHYASTSDSPEDTILKNIKEYETYADRARDQGANILVFPEYGLTTLVTDPEQYAVEVVDSNSIITKLKNLVSARNVYAVINLLEKVQESNKATKYYNTNLVFSRNGTIILKYRKINLYQEPNLTPGDSNQVLTFTTDFGVTFGVFTSYDILFENPSRTVLQSSSVTDIVYPTAWYAVMPFATALTVQHGYAIATGVNLLAANYGKPQDGHGGSGIYLADGKIAETYIADSASSKPIIQDVIKNTQRIEKATCLGVSPFGLPGDSARSNVTNYKTIQSFQSSEYTFKSVDLSQKNSTIEVCDNGFCCTFDIVVDLNKDTGTDHYKVMAFDGSVSYDSTTYNARICSLLACETDSVDTCGARLNTTTSRFTKVTVRGNVKQENGTFYVPVTLNSYLLPIKETSYCINKNTTDFANIRFETYKGQENLLVFGIYGKTSLPSASQSVHAFGFFVLMVLSVFKVVVF